MTVEFFIPGPLPGLNEIIKAAKSGKGKCNAYSRMKQEWTGHVFAIVNHVNESFERVVIDFTWYEKDRRRDPDNIAAGRKFILDALVHAGVIENDGWKQIIGWNDIFAVSKDWAGVHVRISGE